MKKSLLFGAAALMAFAANAQTMTGITKVWEHSMSAYTSSVARSIAALGDKAVIPNRSNGMVEVWDEEVFSKVVVHHGTVMWPDGSDLCPDEVYDNSVRI